MTAENANTVWAEAFVDELARSGVREICLTPGSRSIPLILAVAAHPALRVHTHLDERSAGFFALGLGKATGRPAGVVTTSGTAAANLLPSVVEAAQAETPLLVLTADRPPYLRHTDASQTIDQVRLYGGFVRAFFDVPTPQMDDAPLRALRALAGRAVGVATGLPVGPVHLNFPFAKPLEPTAAPAGIREAMREFSLASAGRDGEAPFVRVTSSTQTATGPAIEQLADSLRAAARTLIVAGPVPDPGLAGAALLRLAGLRDLPLLADPLPGARFAPGSAQCALSHYDAFLRDPELWSRLTPDLILRFGAAPMSSAVADFLEHFSRVRQVVVDPGWLWKDHLSTAAEYLPAAVAGVASALADRVGETGRSAWTDRWRDLDRCARETFAQQHADRPFEGTVLSRIVGALPEGTNVLVGNSMPIRDLDRFVTARNERLRVHGNRGASGIDGLVSTALGVAAASSGPTVAILGDLSFYHDLNGLFAARGVGDATGVVFVVINNDGGGIFHMLPIREFEPAFTRHIVVPHGLDFSHAARLYGLPFTRLGMEEDVAGAVTAALETDGSAVIELSSEREQNRRRHEESLAAVRAAARTLAWGERE